MHPIAQLLAATSAIFDEDEDGPSEMETNVKNFAVVPNTDRKPSMLVTGDDYGGVKVESAIAVDAQCWVDLLRWGRRLHSRPPPSPCRSRCSTTRAWPMMRRTTDSTDTAATSRAVGYLSGKFLNYTLRFVGRYQHYIAFCVLLGLCKK